MLTRKRAREKPDKCFQFDPVMYAVTTFLSWVECGCVAQLNKRFSQRFWKYLLGCKHRAHQWICFSVKSYVWMSKYRDDLRYQHIVLYSKHRLFCSLQVPRIAYLRVCDGSQTIRLPKSIEGLCWSGGSLPDLHHVGNLTYKPYSLIFLCSIPKRIQTLEIILANLSLRYLPHLPNLQVLRLTNLVDLQDIEYLSAKCPQLHTVILNSIGEGLAKLQVHTLVVNIPNCTDLHRLADIQVQELDVSRCSKLTNFLPVNHIPRVIKYSQ